MIAVMGRVMPNGAGVTVNDAGESEDSVAKPVREEKKYGRAAEWPLCCCRRPGHVLIGRQDVVEP
jgi:hypothetical protein